MSSSSAWYWLSDAEYVYVLAEARDTGGETYQIKILRPGSDGTLKQTGSGVEIKTMSKAQYQSEIVSQVGKTVFECLDPESSFAEIPNLILLMEVDKPTILNNLRGRFFKDEIYTWLGTILVALNPFKMIPGIYDDDVIEMHRECRNNRTEAPPHVFAIASAAYYDLVEENRNQAIVVSGESGAGKTESAKLVLKYLSGVAGSSGGSSDAARRIIASSPLLEAFGNAKTVRNDNSSRFGKWMVINFSEYNQIAGCSNVNYLLEKSCVVTQEAGERNFHIFYQLTAGAPAEVRAAYKLEGPSKYAYMTGGNMLELGRGKDDVGGYAETVEAMDELGFDDRERDGMFRIVAAIAHLGNVTFDPRKDGEESAIAAGARSSVQAAADILKVPAKTLEFALLHHVIGAGGSVYEVPHNPEKAKDSRDAFAKEMYRSLFDWLVRRVNVALAAGTNVISASSKSIGILDIFGFEIFENNSFEQLCISE